ncbi:TPA: hypothetical protein DCZ46_01600 [Candidatus Campbellbacteria bacterium]|nr:MAG: seg [Candidatus Campbellbacteria bacterium GW2011_OD1_34_28]KKP75223.1 MAG: hypothetical protein UR74_C0001G0079 [Candidatus Campbellbacteria bacterium GW2011_GWD2_35_24]KKP76216.1 MAG: hypothetical protein UR75_C0001G0250 [Candidatus Campbellbacteria bacterium GW2011_GWC2_35_28]KKP77405.1 MAG: hypothetical protein UR76_C0001G0250 [Candidatus Campbellbacteria bacterium GW2011_GWC1_35_31]KKP79334.1 MAG: hypothetical protein UR79_C0001G0250 [Candidatus Campbellbacteria bacterium GW2011_GW
MKKRKEFLIKMLLVVIIANVIVLASMIFFYSMIKKTNQDIFDLETELLDWRKKQTESSLINDNLDDTARERYKINAYFVKGDKVGVANFIENLENIGKVSEVTVDVSGLFLKDSDKTNTEEIVEVGSMGLNLKIMGKWENVIHFLKLLEVAPYRITFEKVYLEKNSAENSVDWNGAFNINVMKLSE